jgi:hypothetical protein
MSPAGSSTDLVSSLRVPEKNLQNLSQLGFTAMIFVRKSATSFTPET